MKSKIIVAGSNGFIGKYLVQEFEALQFEVLQISRHPKHIQWHENKQIIEAMENALAVINLAGKSVDCRYTKKNKLDILNSRIDTTKTLGECITFCKNPPEIWFNSSTATIYRHETERPNNEQNGIFGEGFSVEIAKSWEKAFFDFELKTTRQIALRMTIILGKNGGAMQPLVNLAKLGLGGQQGKGSQYFSWLHIKDLFSIIQFCIQNKTIKGSINCGSPNAIQNSTLMKALRTKVGMPLGLPIPEFLLKVGAILINTEAELVLKSRWIEPKTLIDNGFKFEFEHIEDALIDVLKRN